MTGSALAATLAQPCSPLHGTIRGSGHATPTNTSRASTPVRARRAVVRAATVGDNRHAPPEPEPEARPALGARSNSAHSLNADQQLTTRRRRLSMATYGEGSEDSLADPLGPQSNAVNATSFLEDARSSASRRNTALSDMEEATPSTCVMALTLPVDAYAVVGPDATVAAAAALAAQDPALRCVVVAAAGMGATHVLDRKVVEQIGRYSPDPGSDSLGSYLAGAPPSASAGPTATVAAAAGLLLSRGGDYLPVVDEGMFMGCAGWWGRRMRWLVSRADVARVMLGRNPDVYGADLEPRVSAGGISPAAAAALAAATAGAGGSGPTTSSGHAYGHGHGHMVAPLAATGSRLALGAAGSAAALSLGPPAPSGCLDSAEVITSAVNLDLTPPGAAAGAAGAADAATSAALGYHSAAAPAGAQPHSGSNHQTQGGAAVSSAANHHGHGHGQQGQQQGQPGQAHSLESVDGAGHSTTSLRSVNDPLVSGWDMLDNVDDAIDVLGLVGKTVNAEAVARADVQLDGGAGKLAFVDISAAYNAVDNGGINFKAAMETVHILSANGQVFKGLTAVLKLLVAVDPDVAAHMGSLTALLPLLSLSYMLISKNRHRLAPLWTAIVRTTKAGAGRAGGRLQPHPPPGGADKPPAGSPRGPGSGAAGEQQQQQQHEGLSSRQQQMPARVPVPVPIRAPVMF
eukprot:XP_001699455.1 predicted protein [Chlamydomonas reinhardtii]